MRVFDLIVRELATLDHLPESVVPRVELEKAEHAMRLVIDGLKSQIHVSIEVERRL